MHKNDSLTAVLKKVVQVIFSETIPYSELKDALTLWRESMEAHHQLEPEAPSYNENVYLEEGKAIAARWAALCIDDHMRTRRFVRAVKKAVDTVLEMRRGYPVTILYAGTGPFATLVLPLTQLYSPEELQLDLVEANKETLRLLRATLDSYEIRDYVRNIYHADATQFRIENTTVDILLVECLQHALSREPQVKIVENLVPQLRSDVILIPEDITLSAALVNTALEEASMFNLDSEQKNEYFEIVDTVFRVNKEDIQSNSLRYDEQILMFSEAQLSDKNRLCVYTEMKLYRDEVLTLNESGLTIPWIVIDFSPEAPVLGVKTRYITGNEPGLDIEPIRTRETSPDSNSI